MDENTQYPARDQSNKTWSMQEIWKYLISAMLGGTVAFFSMGLMGQTQPTPLVIEPPLPTATAAPTSTPAPIRVYINGAIQKEGVYTLHPNSILEELIALAEGFSEEAFTDPVNLAQPLRDGMQIYIPTTEEQEKWEEEIAEVTIIQQEIASDESHTTQNAPVNESGLVNINTADQNTLESLPGVGPSTAEKIIAYREQIGQFATIQDIMNVSGIGTGKFADMEPHITVD